MPHRAAISKSVDSTKLRVIFDVYVKSESGFLLNDCLDLEKGLPLQNELWVILIISSNL